MYKERRPDARLFFRRLGAGLQKIATAQNSEHLAYSYECLLILDDD